MNVNIDPDFSEMEKLKYYVDKGRIAGAAEGKEQPMVAVEPDASLISTEKTNGIQWLWGCTCLLLQSWAHCFPLFNLFKDGLLELKKD